MPGDGRLSDKTESPALSPPTTGLNRRSSQQHHQGSAVSPSRRSQPHQAIQTNTPFFIPQPGQGHGQAQEYATVAGKSGLPASLSRGAVPSSVFPSSPPPPQSYTSPSPYAHRNSFTGQLAMASQPQSPYQTPPPQSYPYNHAHAHRYRPHPGLSLESGQFPQNPPGFLPMVQHHLQPYFQHQSHSPDGNHPPYPHASHTPLPAPQPAPGNPGPSHTASYGGQQYPPLHYGSPSSPFGFPSHYQPSPYQWYYVPGSPGPPFNDAIPVQFQHHYPMNYSQQQQNQHPRHGETETRNALSTECSGPLQSSPNVKPSPVPSSRKPVPPPSLPPLAQAQAPAPPAPVINNLEKNSTVVPSAGTSRAQTERPVIRRSYHPKPPAHRSEWVMWAGNVPGDTTHDELWRFLKRPTSPKPGKEDVEGEDDGVTSIFLISRSNCAFVNFDSEEHLLRAISLFNGQQLRPQDRRCPRLVCRARRKEDDLRAGVGGQRGMGVHMQYIRKMRQRSNEQAEDEQPSSEDRSLVPALSSDEEMTKSQPWAGADLRSPKAKARSASSYASTNSSFLTQHFPKRFFILKSLTQFDLDLSVERGLWATQKHNEAILDQAFRTSKEVILIFGVNKSGEFFGYARMTGRILHGEHRISWASRADSSPSSLSSLSSAAGRRHSRGTPGEPESPLLSTGSRGSPLTYFTPSERRLVEVSPLPFSPPQGDNSGAKEVRIPPQERQSAPPAFGRPQRDFSAEPPAPKFSLNTKLYPDITLAAKESATIAPKEIVLDKTAPARAVRNNRGSLDDSKSAISSLHPVEEEKHNCSGGDDDDGAQSPTQSPTQAGEGREAGWGQTFKIEWICTERLPFYRTRHLRNVWNHDREIKVSRDGTELEPGVGQQLVEEWSTLAADAANGDESRSADSGKRAAKSTSALACYGESKGDEDEPS